MRIHHLMLFLHLAAVVTWVGGMAFAYLCLRPAAAQLPPALRLPLWVGVLRRFFVLVWVAIALILVSGTAMLVEVGFGSAPKAWHAMLVTGLVMMAVFVSLWVGPWARLCAAVGREEWAAGAVALSQIRQRVGFNLVLGFFTVATATLGLGLSL